MKIIRRKTRIIKIGDVSIGGNHPIAIQSMAKTKTADICATIKQIKELEDYGCEIVRLAVRDIQDARALKKIKQKTAIPIVADIHFHWRLAMEAINSGVDKIRLNPGNIYQKDEVIRIAEAAKKRHIPIRVGLNSGSLRERTTVSGQMVKSALNYIKILEGCGFYDIIVSLKASNILDTIEAYRKISKLCDYPLHLGLTATGLVSTGAVKSSIALGYLLLEGLGDTIRISLTSLPQEEVKIARDILAALGLRHFGPEIISCPTCGRCEVDLVKIVKDLESKLSTIDYRLSTRPLKLAVMGCVVNGPGEAKEADLGVAFGRKEGLLFKHGKSAQKVGFRDCVNILLKETRRIKCPKS